MKLIDYAKTISLAETYIHPEIISTKNELILALDSLINFFYDERNTSVVIPESIGEKRKILQGLLNQRMPADIPDIESKLLDRILWTERLENGIVELKNINDIWRGDITQLNVDAIVNAANSDLLGCFHPLHACIDNAIHSAAGPQLREDCNKIMRLQGDKEETGLAKITRAYNLPSKYVLHTVGPIVDSSVTKEKRRQLESSYISCLNLASELEEIRSIAFCCISTGVFGYPKEDAASTAISIVKKWTENNSGRFDRIIFNVFTEEDYDIYQRHI